MSDSWVEVPLKSSEGRDRKKEIQLTILKERYDMHHMIKIFLLVYGLTSEIILMDHMEFSKRIRLTIPPNKILREMFYNYLVELKSSNIRLYYSYAFTPRYFDIIVAHKSVTCIRREL